MSSFEFLRDELKLVQQRLKIIDEEYYDPIERVEFVDSTLLWYVERQRPQTAQPTRRKWWMMKIDGDAVDLKPLFDDHAAKAALGIDDSATWSIEDVVVKRDEKQSVDVFLRCILSNTAISYLHFHNDKIVIDDDASVQFKSVEMCGTRTNSGTSDASTHLTFNNQLSVSVDIIWIDFDGKECSCGALAPGESRRQQTFASHVWLLRCGAVNIGYITAAVSERTVLINKRYAAPVVVGEPAGVPTAVARTTRGLKVVQSDSNFKIVDTTKNVAIFGTFDGTDQTPYCNVQLSAAGDACVALSVKKGSSKTKIYHFELPGMSVTSSSVTYGDEMLPRPKLCSVEYTKPGDSVDIPTLVVFNISDAFEVRRLALQSSDVFADAFRIDSFKFLPTLHEVALLFNRRGHKDVMLLAVNLSTGAVREIVGEHFPTFVDYVNKIWMHWLKNDSHLLWMSERSGYNQLYLVDVATGSCEQVTFDGLVRRVLYVDDERRFVDYEVMGLSPASRIYDVHVRRLLLDNRTIVQVMAGDGVCRCIVWSPERGLLVTARSAPNMPPVYELWRCDGSSRMLLRQLGSAEAPAAMLPQIFVGKGRDGVTAIYGIYYKPSCISSEKKYPVIENIYAGPHGMHVPTQFDAGCCRSREYAEWLDCFVVQIAGTGTNWRGKQFHDVSYLNLCDAGLPDRIAWIKQLAERGERIDLDRVCIFGGSAGGQSAMRAAIDYGEFYKAAVADCGCHDNNFDKLWWNELWLGTPQANAAAYALNSNAVHAYRLVGKLMLIVGGCDTNVDSQSTMLVVQRLIDAGKDFELLVIPSAGHGCAETPYGNLRRARFLFDAVCK